MSAAHKGWIGVDLDGTLARYDGWKGIAHVGEPIPAMVARVKGWLATGQEVRIFTARVSPMSIAGNTRGEHGQWEIIGPISDWCEKHLGQRLLITHEKDLAMIELWDDRCVQVIPNTGQRADGRP